MQSGEISRRAGRALYWLGMAAVPFVGAAAAVVTVFAIMQSLGVAFAVGPPIVIVVGVASWAGLIRLYRAFVPLPCLKCGRRFLTGWATSRHARLA
jgi:hypothetical protein